MQRKLLIFLLIPFLFIGCSSPQKNTPQAKAGFPLTIPDAFGQKVKLEKEPERIISLAPSQTEILAELGLEAEIVGITKWCNWPQKIQGKTVVGDLNLNYEQIAALEPDLIVGIRSMQEKDLQRLAKMGYTVLALEPEGVEGTIKTIETLGLATGRLQEAEKIVARIQKQLARIKPKAQRPKVLLVLDLDPLYTVGPGSLQDELLTQAGADNIARETNSPWPQLSDEIVIAENPEIILVTADQKQQIQSKAAWKNIEAVKNGAIYQVDPDLISRPGPRIGEAALELAELFTKR